MRVTVVDPSAFTPPYDHALCTALARAGASVELATGPFAYGAAPSPDGYVRAERFYRRVPGAAGSRVRTLGKAVAHVPDMLAFRRAAARRADVVHFQWLDVQWLDRWLLPRRPVVLTAHDLLPREPRPGQAAAQRRLYDAVDALIVHSEYGRAALVDGLGLDPALVHVVHHGAFTHLTELSPAPLPVELGGSSGAELGGSSGAELGAGSGAGVGAGPGAGVGAASEPGAPPVVLFFGLLRPYKGVETLLRAWEGISDAELWIVGRPRMDVEPLRALAASSVRFVPRFVSDAELAACFRAADIVVLPYERTERFDQSGVLATALGFGVPIVASDIGGFGEVAATGAVRLVPPGDAGALRDALTGLLGAPEDRARLAAAARAAAAGPYSWDAAALRTLSVYRSLV